MVDFCPEAGAGPSASAPTASASPRPTETPCLRVRMPSPPPPAERCGAPRRAGPGGDGATGPRRLRSPVGGSGPLRSTARGGPGRRGAARPPAPGGSVDPELGRDLLDLPPRLRLDRDAVAPAGGLGARLGLPG